jgi:hypothetical protein
MGHDIRLGEHPGLDCCKPLPEHPHRAEFNNSLKSFSLDMSARRCVT